MTNTSTEAAQALIRKLRSQIGDDVQEVYSHDTLFKLASEMLMALQTRAESAEAREVEYLDAMARLAERATSAEAERDRLATAHAQMQQTIDRLTADNERLQAALEACVIFADAIADAAEIDMEETCFQVRVMPEGREVATKSWAKVQGEARTALAASQTPDPVTNADCCQAPSPPEHYDDYCIRRFAELMSKKIAASRAKDHNGWHNPE